MSYAISEPILMPCYCRMGNVSPWAVANRRIRAHLYQTALRLGGGDTLRNLSYLQLQERLPREEAIKSQQARLRSLLSHASNRVPYYRSVLADSGVVGGSREVDLDRFRDMPLLD